MSVESRINARVKALVINLQKNGIRLYKLLDEKQRSMFSPRRFGMQEIITEVEKVAKKYEILKVAILGSYARGEANDETDIDLAFEFGEIGMEIGGLKVDLEESLGKQVDIFRFGSISTLISDEV